MIYFRQSIDAHDFNSYLKERCISYVKPVPINMSSSDLASLHNHNLHMANEKLALPHTTSKSTGVYGIRTSTSTLVGAEKIKIELH